MSDVDRKQRELYTRQQQLLREQRTADQEKLLSTISGVQSFACSLTSSIWCADSGLSLGYQHDSALPEQFVEPQHNHSTAILAGAWIWVHC